MDGIKRKNQRKGSRGIEAKQENRIKRNRSQTREQIKREKRRDRNRDRQTGPTPLHQKIE